MKFLPMSIAVLLAATTFTVACNDDDPTDPDETEFEVALNRANESPVCANAPLNATGSADVTLSNAATSITLSSLQFANLSGPVTGAHIHFGAAGANGGIVINFGATVANPLPNNFGDVFTVTDYLTPSGAPATLTLFIAAVRAGNAYINLHTANCPDGEVRGQILADD